MSSIKSYIGFAVKSGKILYGIDNIIQSRKRKYVMVICKTASENLADKARKYSEKNGIPLIMAELPLEEMVHKTNCKLIAISDANLASAVIGTNGR